MAYTIKITSKTNPKEGVILKLNLNKELPLQLNVQNLVSSPDNKWALINAFGHQTLSAYAKLKDNKGWGFICDINFIEK
jgi:hypothetical protein